MASSMTLVVEHQFWVYKLNEDNFYLKMIRWKGIFCIFFLNDWLTYCAEA